MSILKEVEAARSSETVIFTYMPTQCSNPEDFTRINKTNISLITLKFSFFLWFMEIFLLLSGLRRKVDLLNVSRI
jgi:hypothetical protein